MKRSGLVGAHRGDRSCRPENTLIALQSSVGRCDFAEIDVQLSRDKVPVIMHDATLERTTDVKGHAEFAQKKPWRVDAFSAKELAMLDYGSWFYATDPFGSLAEGRAAVPKEGAFAPLLTLSEALRFAVRNELVLNVEIKDMRGSFDDTEAVGKVLDCIVEEGASHQVLLSSFNHDYLKLCKELLPDVPVCALQEGKHPAALTEYLNTLGVEGYHCSDELADADVLGRLGEAGFFTGVYTVNDLRRRRELFAWGVNAVFTDFLE